jgi:hypothetical protein
VLFQFVQFELNDSESLDAASFERASFDPVIWLGRDEIGCDLILSLSDCLAQKSYIFVSILDTVKRGLEWSFQG